MRVVNAKAHPRRLRFPASCSASSCFFALAFLLPANETIAAELPDCESGLRPTVFVAPVLPRLPHNEFAGELASTFNIEMTGRTSAIDVVEVRLRPVGHGGGEPVGYVEAMSKAIGQWVYPERDSACRHRHTFPFCWVDGDGVKPRCW